MLSSRTRQLRRATVATAGLFLVLFAVIAVTSLGWIGTTFPGFFVMANRVIPSIALPEWRDDPGRLFQHQVLAVDGVPVSSADQVYEAVAARPAGTPITYGLRSPGGAVHDATVVSQTFSRTDFALLFGAYLVNGVAFLAIGLLVFLLKPDDRPSRALFAATTTTSVFIVTAADLYGPHWFFRLHVLAESLLAASFLHLALVFPTDRLRGRRKSVLIAVYAPFLALAAWYETVLGSPSAYTAAHLVASAAHGLAGMTLIAVVVHDFLSSPSALVRRRIGVVAVGAFAGLVVPVGLMAGSALVGGGVALNAGAITAFLFPLSIGYAIVKRDLFEIDVLLRRALTYAIVVAASVLVYLTMFALFGALVPSWTSWSFWSLVWATLNLAMVYLFTWLRARVQDAVDRVFFRKAYDPEAVLAELSHELACARSTEQVGLQTARVLGRTFWPRSVALLVRGEDALLHDSSPGDARPPVALRGSIRERLAAGEILARYEWEDGTGHALPGIWRTLDADVLVPIRQGDGGLDILALGAKASGRPYNVLDISLLRTAANQIALALGTAAAFAQLAALNSRLEEEVRARTRELGATNVELNESLGKLRTAYEKLEASQRSLTRADRLATLGRLTAGIAHELNTPLGGVLNALKILTDLGNEYAQAIDDPSVTSSDHHEIATEIVETAQTAAGWARKAASFVSKVKVHGRDPGDGAPEPFSIGAIVDEIRALLAHRLRTSGCRVEYAEHPRGLQVLGSQARLAQVLTNLIGNALDAYEDRGTPAGAVEVEARREDDRVVVTVTDCAGGIPEEVLPRIFDELFTTKERGRGTGLGLWIARNLVEQQFGGTLTVATTRGVGSRFTIVLPEQHVQSVPSRTPREADDGGANAPVARYLASASERGTSRP
ncbi:MAG: ATP-binding protein [Thermodesulfobacteriota bacterium]